MTKEQKIQQILTILQNDESKLLKLLLFGISNNIAVVPEERIDQILTLLTSEQ